MRLRVPEQIVSRLEKVGFKTLETFTREPRLGEHQCKKFYLRAVRVEENALPE